MSLRQAVRERLLKDMLRDGTKWRLLVVDAAGLRVLNGSLTMSQVLSENITAVEALSNKRKPSPTTEAIYFIAPTPASIKAVISDFSPTASYAAAHLYCISTLPDHLLSQLRHSAIKPHLKALKELNIDFTAVEHHCFSLDTPDCWYSLFNPPAASLLRYELQTIAKKLVSVLGTTGDYPYVRFHSRNDSVSHQFGLLVQDELNALCRLNPSFPPVSPFKRPVLVIVDRSIDCLAPLLHEFSYQAMVADLLGLVDGKFYDAADQRDVLLDDTDRIWDEVHCWHIAEVLEYLPELFKRFASENKAAQYELEGASTDKIQSLKDAMGSMPEYQHMKALYTLHTRICEQVMATYNQRNLEKVVAVEQNLVMNDPDASHSALKTLLRQVEAILGDSSIQQLDKVRLLMLAVISQGGVSDAERHSFVEHARLSVEDSQALTNLSYLNVRLSALLDTSKKRHSLQDPYVNPEIIKRVAKAKKQFKFDNSRYTPLVKFILQDQCNSAIQPSFFSWVMEPPVGEFGLNHSENPALVLQAHASIASNTAASRKKPSWATRKTANSIESTSALLAPTDPTTQPDLRANGPRIILFVLGGMTHSEIRAASEVRKEMQRDVLIGSTHIWHPDGFVEALKVLHRGEGRGDGFTKFKRPEEVISLTSRSSSKHHASSRRDRYDDDSSGRSGSSKESRYDRNQPAIASSDLPRRDQSSRHDRKSESSRQSNRRVEQPERSAGGFFKGLISSSPKHATHTPQARVESIETRMAKVVVGESYSRPSTAPSNGRDSNIKYGDTTGGRSRLAAKDRLGSSSSLSTGSQGKYSGNSRSESKTGRESGSVPASPAGEESTSKLKWFFKSK